MQEYLVSLDIQTSPISPGEFGKRYGVSPALFKATKLKGRMLWRLESKLGKTATLAEHLKAVFRKSSIVFRGSKRQKPYVNIGVLYDTYTCTIQIPDECIKLMKMRGVDMEICCYPTEFSKKRIRRH